MNHTALKRLVTAALFAAMTTITTAYILHIPFPGGYFHLGDVFIYLCACLLPAPYAIAAGAIGGGMADLLTYPSWVVPTLIIKGIVAACFSSKSEKMFCGRNLVGLAMATILSPTLYAFAQVIMTGAWESFPVQFIGTGLQGLFNAALFLVLAPVLDRVGMKSQLKLA